MSLKLSQASLISGVKRHTLNARVNNILDKEELTRASNNQILLSSKQVKMVIYDHINKLKGKVIYITNPRQGAGKTTLSLLLSKSLKALDFRVCCIDLDPQSKLTKILLGKQEVFLTLYDFITRKSNFSDIILKVSDNLDLIPSSIAVGSLEETFINHGNNFIDSYISNFCLNYLRSKYDLIIIDTPSNMSLLSLMFSTNLKQTDEILYPVNLDTFSSGETQGIIRNLYNANNLFQQIEFPEISFFVNKFIDKQKDSLKKLLQKGEESNIFIDCFSGIVIDHNNEINKLLKSDKEFSNIKTDRNLFKNIRSLLCKINAVK